MKIALAASIVIAMAIIADMPTSAQSVPTPQPAATPVVFAAHAHGTVTFVTKTKTYDITAQVALANRDRLFRIDLVSIRSTTLPIPSPSLTLVYDRASRNVTIWNDARRIYYVQSLIPAPPSPGPSTPPESPFSGRSPLADLDVFSLSVALGDRTTTAGIATTGLTTTLDVRKRGDAQTVHVKATLQLADDFAGVPVRIDATADDGTGGVNGTFAYAIDDFARVLPSDARFTPPTGYRLADSWLAVVLGRLSSRPPITPAK